MNIDDSAWGETYSLVDDDINVNTTDNTRYTVIMDSRDVITDVTYDATYWICLDAIDQWFK